jgi:WD40 repeat protein
VFAFPWTLAVAQPDPIQKSGPRVDQYGDPLPAHALIRIGTTRLRPNVDNDGAVEAMAFTKDGRRLVTMNHYTGGKVWDAVTGKKLLAFGKPASLAGVKFALSADGSRAAIVESEKVCRFYDTANGKEIGRATVDWELLDDLRFSPNNKLLGALHSSEPFVGVWDVASGSKLWQMSVPLGICSGAFAFTPDEKIIVAARRPGSKPATDGNTRPLPLLSYDAAQGPKSEYASPLTIVFPPGSLWAADGKEFTFSPDGKLLAAREYSRQFMLWNFTTRKLLHEPKIDDEDEMGVCCLCFSPDSKGIFTGSSKGRVRLWDVVTGRIKREFPGHDRAIHALAVSPDSKRVAASCWDTTLRVWDVDSGKELLDFDGHRMRNVQARFGSNGKTIVTICGFNPSGPTADERTYRIWDATTGKPLKRVELNRKQFLPFCLSGDANVLFVIDVGKVTKKNLSSGRIEEVRGLPANYYRYQCSTDGRYLAGHTDDFWSQGRSMVRNVDDLVTTNTLKVVDTAAGKEVLHFEGRKGEQFHCRFTHDGRYLAVNSFCYETNGSAGYRSNMELKQSFLTIWDMQTGRKTSEGNLLERKWNGDFRWPGGDSLSPDRTRALTRGKDFVELRDVKTNSKLAQFEADNLGMAGALECENWAFSGNGDFIAIGNEKGQILLWSVSARKPLGTLEGHRAAVTSVHFSPDGKKLLSGSDDTTIVLWNIAQWTAPAATPN